MTLGVMGAGAFGTALAVTLWTMQPAGCAAAGRDAVRLFWSGGLAKRQGLSDELIAMTKTGL